MTGGGTNGAGRASEISGTPGDAVFRGAGGTAAPGTGAIGVVADDITGAGDIGIMFAKNGMPADIYSFTPDGGFSLPPLDPDGTAILDTDSRFDKPEEAYRKVYAATKLLQSAGCGTFINKTCSVFRGNIGAEFDAMLDALGEEFAIVVLGFPKNGRTTVDGIHYVRGRRLEESEFRNDPVHPMTRSDLAGILREQTKRSVDTIDHTVIEQGAEALRAAIRQKKAACQYLILDVTGQDALRTIAEAVQGEKVLCGSSALAEELSLLRRAAVREQAAGDAGAANAASADAEGSSAADKAAVADATAAPAAAAAAAGAGAGTAAGAAGAGGPAGFGASLPPLRPGVGLFAAAGSLMPQTTAQIGFLRDAGVPVLTLDTFELLDEGKRTALLEDMVRRCCELMAAGQDVAVDTTRDPDSVRLMKERAASAGYDNTAVSRLVSEALAEITAQVMERTGQRRALIAGGDTSAAVCRRLGVQGMRVWKEIEPGLPSCVTHTDRPMLLALKSGSFGAGDFFRQAFDHLRAQ